jgi:hypothetical protein
VSRVGTDGSPVIEHQRPFSLLGISSARAGILGSVHLY